MVHLLTTTVYRHILLVGRTLATLRWRPRFHTSLTIIPAKTLLYRIQSLLKAMQILTIRPGYAT